MSMKEFVEDFKTMIKTKSFSPFNEKYIKPAARKSKEIIKKAFVGTKNAIAKYTPKIVAGIKTIIAKIKALIAKVLKKDDKATKNAETTAKASGAATPTAAPTPAPTSPTT